MSYGRNATVILGDGTTTRPVQGWGYARYRLNGIPIRRKELYIPDLGTHLTSITQHYKYQDCYFHAENRTALLAFPSVVLQVDCDHELSLPISHSLSSDTLIFNEETAPPSADESSPHTTSIQLTSQPMCKYISENAQATNTNTDTSPPLHQAMHEPQHEVLIKPLTDNIRIPSKGTPGSAGFDVYNPSPQELPPHSITKIPLNFSLAFHHAIHAQLTDRSSLALRNITVKGGIIDSDYRGNVILCLQNNSNHTQVLPGGPV